MSDTVKPAALVTFLFFTALNIFTYTGHVKFDVGEEVTKESFETKVGLSTKEVLFNLGSPDYKTFVKNKDEHKTTFFYTLPSGMIRVIEFENGNLISDVQKVGE